MDFTPIRSINLLGICLDVLDIPSLNELVRYSIENRKKWIIANHNLHSVYLYHYAPGMADFYKAAKYVHADGMSLIFIAKILGFSLTRKNRIAYIDWLYPLLELASNNSWKIFYLGSIPAVANRAEKILQKRFPGLMIKTHHGYFNPDPNSEENLKVAGMINEFNPDILMVGMGMPRQEKWILNNLEAISFHVILNAGACMDYFAHEVPMTPRWLGDFGLEWLYRLVLNPIKYWKRYLIEPWFLLRYFFSDLHNQLIKRLTNKLTHEETSNSDLD